jgi:hypothetical protein
MWWKQHKWKVIVPVLVIAILAAAFWYGGGAPGLQGWTVESDKPVSTQQTPAQTAEPVSASAEQQGDVQTSDPVTAPTPEATSEVVPEATPEPTPESAPETGIESRPGGLEGGMTAQEKLDAAAKLAGGSSPGVMAGDKDYSESQGMVIDPTTGKDKYMTDPVPEGKPLPVEPQNATISDAAYTCTLSISCATILDHMEWLDPEKVELVPEDGWILPPTQVTFYEGESVFNVLQRTCKQQKIHMEFENTPMYNSAYIEGIHNLYEFDCGELSGWMYKVNEWFPNYGCSRYQLHDGDVVCWVYTCDLGIDVGGYYSTGG